MDRSNCGNMFSGKTEELIRRLRRAQIAKMSTVIFKPEIDLDLAVNITSHNMNKLKSIILLGHQTLQICQKIMM